MTNPMAAFEKYKADFDSKRREYLADLAEQFIDGSCDEAMGALEELFQSRRAAQDHKRDQEVILHGDGSTEPVGVIYATTETKRGKR